MQVLIYPDERLSQPAEAVENFDATLRHNAIATYKTMVRLNGAGLAAPQVGIAQSFFVIQRGLMDHEIIVNPTWKKSTDAKSYMATEGCLSFPGLFIEVERFDKIDVQYQYVDAKLYSVTLDGFAAHVFQHESDHLVGTLMIDHLKLKE
jgi:peptide deformylase